LRPRGAPWRLPSSGVSLWQRVQKLAKKAMPKFSYVNVEFDGQTLPDEGPGT
jgi:hypothetical protein